MDMNAPVIKYMRIIRLLSTMSVAMNPDLLILILSTFAVVINCAATESPDGLYSRIDQVENNLLPAVVEAGSPTPGMSLSERMHHYMIPGVSFAMINDSDIEWAKGYGVTDAAGLQVVNPDTLFQAASISKPVAAVGVMLLNQSGTIDLDRNSNDYLRSWHIPDNELTSTEKVTIRRLLSHTGGLGVPSFMGYEAGMPIPNLLDILDGVGNANNDPVRVELVPGSMYSYSGGGYEVLQLLIKDVTNNSFREYMRDYLLQELGMNSSDFIQPIDWPLKARAASGHDCDGKALPGKWRTYPELAAAGLWTTPTDIARLTIELQKAANGDKGTVLTEKTAKEILTGQVSLGDGSTMGLGFPLLNTSGDIQFSYMGSNAGYKTCLVAYRDRGQGAVIMTNGDNGADLCMEILRSVAKVYGWQKFKPEERNLVDVPVKILESYVGSYKQAERNETYSIALSNTGLVMKAGQQIPAWFDMYSVSDNRFLLRSVNLYGDLHFKKDSAGNVDAFEVVGATNFTAKRL